MAKRTDISSILIIGAGPIVIGQACEFDYSGVQACKALREEGYRVILVNSNPATIMTDPEMADATYIEPIRWQTVAKIIEQEKPDALLPTMGGQTALNCALDLDEKGILKQYGVEMIGASPLAIETAEDRLLFRKAMDDIGLESPRSHVAETFEEALEKQSDIGFPTVIRPAFTLGGSGGGIAYNQEEFEAIVSHGLELSPISQVLLDESLLGWKEFEMEVVRDKNDNCIIVCSIENVDAMGIHTGDSITVAPAQTLTDKEYQLMRDASMAVLRRIGVETGGSNVQFAINPADGRMVIIEMNPRVSRSSALASKATGFPIAKVAAKLAIGYTLDELSNEITGGLTPASFEPSIDYVVLKIPRFAFEKFPGANNRLNTQMKSVGEAMAIGRTFKESLQKALRSLENDLSGFDTITDADNPNLAELRRELQEASNHRLQYVADAFRHSMPLTEVQSLSGIDPWFLHQINELVETEQWLAERELDALDADKLFFLKRQGFADARIASLLGRSEIDVIKHRQQSGIRPAYKRVDTCAAEFPTDTAYLYSTYEKESEALPSNNKKIMILGSGPNRIGQGIEFDCCCVHAAFALRDNGLETIMVNCNPETVSTDYDTSDRLYFEPLTLEDVLEIVEVEKPAGVIVQFGGQTPLKLARKLEANGVPVIGTSPDNIDLAEDRERFQQMLERLGLQQPPNRTAKNETDALRLAEEIGYPLVVRPSYVLGGRAMDIVHASDELERYMREAVKVSNDSPVLLDRFLDHAIEVDVDAVCDGTDVLIGGIMEHVEKAGVHSGDSSCCLPPFSLNETLQDQLRVQVVQLAKALNVIGLMNVQFAIQGDDIFILEVNPRAARTVPFVSKVTGVPLAKIAALCMAGFSLKSQGYTEEVIPKVYAVKEPVFPFIKFPGVDPILGPEMRSTGEVMGFGDGFGEAIYRAGVGAGYQLPEPVNGKLRAFLSVRDADKQGLLEIARDLLALDYELVATRGTCQFLTANDLPCEPVNKVVEGRPHVVDQIINGDIQFIVNTTEGRQAIADSYSIRREALQHQIYSTTTLAYAKATLAALKHAGSENVRCVQSVHSALQENSL